MGKLEQTHLSVYNRFMQGLFVLRRSDSYWSGIFSDLYIEQVLMGSIKSVGGLTQGRGFDNSNSLVWLLSTPACGEVHKAIQEITTLSNSHTNEIHKDRRKSRMERDLKDMQSILDYFTERKPFGSDRTELHSLSSGIVAEKSVNVDSAKSIGAKIVRSMEGMSVSQFKFKKKEQVVTLASSVYVSVDGEKVEMDPKHLYQRLLVAGIGTVDVQTLFQYELSSYPTSLFDQKLFMRQADKSDLLNGLIKRAPASITEEIPSNVVFVVDGGAFLQQLPWPKTYSDLTKLYIQYLHHHFPMPWLYLLDMKMGHQPKMKHTREELERS